AGKRPIAGRWTFADRIDVEYPARSAFLEEAFRDQIDAVRQGRTDWGERDECHVLRGAGACSPRREQHERQQHDDPTVGEYREARLHPVRSLLRERDDPSVPVGADIRYVEGVGMR